MGAIFNPKNWIAKERLSFFIGRAAYWRGWLQECWEGSGRMGK